MELTGAQHPCPRLTLNPAFFPTLSDENLSSRIDRLNHKVQQVLSSAVQQPRSPSLSSLDSGYSDLSECELLLNRTQMQLEDVLAGSRRKDTLLWESEDEIEIGGYTAREPIIPSSPASSPPKLLRKNGLDIGCKDEVAWTCTQTELTEVLLTLHSLLSRPLPVQCVPLQVGPVHFLLSMQSSPQFPSKPLLSRLVSLSLPALPSLPSPHSYIQQLENELVSLPCLPPLSCPHNPQSNEWNCENLLFRSSSKPNFDLETGIKSRLTTIERDLSLRQAVSKWQMRDLTSAIRELRQCKEEYLSVAQGKERVNREMETIRREREMEIKEAGRIRRKLKAVEEKTNDVSAALHAFLSQCSLPVSPYTEECPEIASQIQALESQISTCRSHETQRLNIKLSLLRNKQVKMRSESVLMGCKMKERKLLSRTMSLVEKTEVSALSACTSPKKQQQETSYARYCLSPEHQPSSPASLTLLSSLSSRIHDLETALIASNRKVQDRIELEILLQNEQKRLKAYRDRLTKRENQLRDREIALLHAEKEENKEKYLEIVRSFYKRERKASEDFLKMKVSEEEMVQERLGEEKQHIKKLLCAVEGRVEAASEVQKALLALYAELQEQV